MVCIAFILSLLSRSQPFLIAVLSLLLFMIVISVLLCDFILKLFLSRIVAS